MSALAKLQSSKANADKVQADRDNYAAYIESMREYGWTDDDVTEYRAEVERIMAHGTTDEKESAREFWKDKTKHRPECGINKRIRLTIEDCASQP